MQRLRHYLSVGTHPGRIPELDGLRAFAIILVLFFHYSVLYQEFSGSYYRGFFNAVSRWFMQNGWVGVDLFLVLSGYLIAHHLIKNQGRIKDRTFLWLYAQKRILRTFPLYFGVMALIMLGLIPHYQPEVSMTDFWIHLFFWQDYTGSNILIPMWSLATEEKFYLLAPLLFFVVKPDKFLLAAGTIIGLAVAVFAIKSWILTQSPEVRHYNSYFYTNRAPFHYAVWSIAVGVGVAFLRPDMKNATARYVSWLVMITLMVLALILCQVDLFKPKHWAMANLWHLLVVLLFGFLVWGCIRASGSAVLAWLRWRFLRIIAVLSYALYLCHYMTVFIVNRWVKQYVRLEEPWAQTLSFLAIYLTLSFVTALLLHYLIEKPFLILKDRIDVKSRPS